MTVFSKIKRATAMIALGGVTLLITLSGSHAAQGKLVVAQSADVASLDPTV